MAFCKNCGAQIPDGTSFCASCGASQQAAPQQPQYVQPQPQYVQPQPQYVQPQPQYRPQPQPQYAPSYNAAADAAEAQNGVYGLKKAIVAMVMAILCMSFAIVGWVLAVEADYSYGGYDYLDDYLDYDYYYSVSADENANGAKVMMTSYYYDDYYYDYDYGYDYDDLYDDIYGSSSSSSGDIVLAIIALTLGCASIAFFIIGLVFGIASIKNFVRARKMYGTFPLATLILGIAAILTVASSIYWIIDTFICGFSALF